MADAERDTDVGPRTDPSPETAQGSSSEPLTSATRLTEPTLGSTTLLSVPASASREELAMEQRLATCERQMQELESRLAGLEAQRRVEPRARGERHWAFWLIFLLGLALAWQIVGLFR
jgi:hypothetical protein